MVFAEALARGAVAAVKSLASRDARSAIQLTLIVAAISVPVNAVFGIAAAWFVTRFDFRGKALLVTLIDLPFSVSPVVAGLCIVLLFGANSAIGGWLVANGWPIVFAIPGIVLATIFVTFPFIARELMPLMEQQGIDEELAALSLGASGWQMFWHITLPNIKWGLIYGVVLCTARAMGEFGAVSVVSGHIRGLTNTLPLHVEIRGHQGPIVVLSHGFTVDSDEWSPQIAALAHRASTGALWCVALGALATLGPNTNVLGERLLAWCRAQPQKRLYLAGALAVVVPALVLVNATRDSVSAFIYFNF